jgi:hypothetical protein
VTETISPRQPYVAELLTTIDRAVPALRALDEALTARRPAPKRWSKREILGHLIDSASNNHQRFVRARWQADLVFQGYAQDDWVDLQGYAEAPWAELVDLWALLNRHLARVMSRVPEAIRSRPRERHNLDRVAYRPVAIDRPATLDYFMADYVDHLCHHLDQILDEGYGRSPSEG